MVHYEFKNGEQFNKLVNSIIKSNDFSCVPNLTEQLQNDNRKYVQKGLSKLYNAIEKEKQENLRLENMYTFENDLYNQGFDYVLGIDEVGRGPFAGPVTVAGVILKKCDFIRYINDSKKLSKELRETLDLEIRKKAEGFVVFSMTNQDIDKFGIKNCTLSCMESCVNFFVQKGYKNMHILIDAEKLKDIDLPQTSIIKGDSKSASIAAASIIAKVHRDNFMEEISKLYPEYDFCSNSGYNSPKHFNAIVELGISPIHRKGFVQSALRNKGIKDIGNKYNVNL